jgi:hypothetical protein
MNDKKHLVNKLRQEFEAWEVLLAERSEAQISAQDLPGNRSIKDVMAHLRGWQQRSIARVEAALKGLEPYFQVWPSDLNPDLEEDVDAINAWILDYGRQQSWLDGHREWRTGFLHFIELVELVPEEDLFQPGRYDWLGDRTLAYIVEASIEHHQEHREEMG